MGEPGTKTVTLITIDDGIEIAELPVSAVEFIRCRLDLSALDSDDDLRDRLRRDLNALADSLVSDDAIVRVELHGATARRWQMLRDHDYWTETARTLARGTGRLWLERLVLDLAEPAGGGAGATDELARLMETLGSEARFADTLRSELEAVLAELPAQRRAALIPDADATGRLSADRTRAGAAWILARMKGSGD